MSTWKITGISLLAASIMGAIFLLVSPANAQSSCWTKLEFEQQLGKNKQLKSKYIEGEDFEKFIDETIAKLGPTPSGHRPAAAYLVSLNHQYVLYFITEHKMVCDRLTIVASTAHGLIKSSLSTPI